MKKSLIAILSVIWGLCLYLLITIVTTGALESQLLAQSLLIFYIMLTVVAVFPFVIDHIWRAETPGIHQNPPSTKEQNT